MNDYRKQKAAAKTAAPRDKTIAGPLCSPVESHAFLEIWDAHTVRADDIRRAVHGEEVTVLHGTLRVIEHLPCHEPKPANPTWQLWNRFAWPKLQDVTTRFTEYTFAKGSVFTPAPGVFYEYDPCEPCAVLRLGTRGVYFDGAPALLRGTSALDARDYQTPGLYEVIRDVWGTGRG